jgi:hypothetical protein
VKLPDPGKLPKKELAEFVRRIQRFLYLDITKPVDGNSVEFWNNKKVVDANDLLLDLNQLLSEYDLLEPEGGVECRFCHELCDEKVARTIQVGGFVCYDCWDERLRQ